MLRTSYGDLVGCSPPMQILYDQLEVVANCDIDVLLRCESAKEGLFAAGAIHSQSQRRNYSFSFFDFGIKLYNIDEMFNAVEYGSAAIILNWETPISNVKEILEHIRLRNEEKKYRNPFRMLIVAPPNYLDENPKLEFPTIYSTVINIPEFNKRISDIPAIVSGIYHNKDCPHKRQPITVHPKVMRQLMGVKWTDADHFYHFLDELYAFYWEGGKTIEIQDIPNHLLEWGEKNNKEIDDIIDFDNFPSYSEFRDICYRVYCNKVVERAEGNISLAARIAKQERTFFYSKLKKFGVNLNKFRKENGIIKKEKESICQK